MSRENFIRVVFSQWLILRFMFWPIHMQCLGRNWKHLTDCDPSFISLVCSTAEVAMWYPSFTTGNSATMVRIVPYAAITYMSNEHYKNYFKRKSSNGELSHINRFASGSLAGLTASFSTYVLEVILVPFSGNDKGSSLHKPYQDDRSLILYRWIFQMVTI